MRKKFLALLLAFAMVAGMLPMTALAAEGFSDLDGHWSQDAVNRWAEVNVLNGDENGNFNPDKSMTRAEFAQMLCNLMGYTEKAENTFTDVPDDAWYADAILKLNAAGVMSGVGGGLAAPNAPISREQAAVLLCRAMNIKPSQSASISFSDAHAVSDWARDAVAALTERGMINGVGNNSFAPALNINRASVATMVNNMVAEYITQDGATVTGEVNGVVIIKASDVKIEDATLSENIIVAPAAQDATVTLTGATAAADIVVAAEGAKVVVAETAAAGSVTVEAPKAEAQVAGKADAIVVAETAEGAKATVAATAEVTDVTVAAPNAETQVAGKVETIAVAETAEGAKATVAKTAEVTDVTVAAPKAETSISGTVSSVAVADTATGANVTANAGAKVDSVTTAAENVTVNGAKDTIASVSATGGSADIKASGAEVKNDGADKVTVDGNKDVAVGESTTSNTSGTTGGSTGGGSSTGGGGSTNPPVETADVVAAPLADQVAENAIASDKLGTVTVSGKKTADKTYAVTITGTNIMKHTNAATPSVDAHWVGFGVPSGEGYTFYDGETLISTATDRKITVDGKSYNTIYFDDSDQASTKTIKVKDSDNNVVATYNVSFNVTFWKATGVSVIAAPSETDAVVAKLEADNTPWAHKFAKGLGFTGTTVNGTTINLKGETTVAKLESTSTGVSNADGYLTYVLKVENDKITKIKLGDDEAALDTDTLGYTTGTIGLVVNDKIYTGANKSFELESTVTFKLCDAAGREQDTVTVTVNTAEATIAGMKKVTVKIVGATTTTQSISVGSEDVPVAVTTPENTADKYYTGKWKVKVGDNAEVDATISDGNYSVSKDTTNGTVITLTAQYVDVTTQEVAVRPAGVAGDDESFDYASAYTAAGITGIATFHVDGTTLATYVGQDTNADNLAKLIHQVNGTNYIFYGLQFTKPSGATKVIVAENVAGLASGKELDLTKDSAGVADAVGDVFKGEMIEYFGVASVTDKKVTFLDAGEWTYFFKWMKGDEVIGVTQATIKREAATNIPVTVTFKGADAEGADVKVVVTKGSKVPTNKFPTVEEKAGYTYCWVAGDTAFTVDTVVDADTEVTLKWTNTAVFTAMSAGVYDLYAGDDEFKEGIPAKDKFDSGVTFTQEGTKFTAKGTLLPITDPAYAGFNKANAGEQTGYYLLFQFEAPASAKNASGTIVKTAKKEFTNTALDEVEGKQIFSFIWWVAEPSTEADGTCDVQQTITIDWDGSGEMQGTAYTLDFSGLTLKQATTATTPDSND